MLVCVCGAPSLHAVCDSMTSIPLSALLCLLIFLVCSHARRPEEYCLRRPRTAWLPARRSWPRRATPAAAGQTLGHLRCQRRGPRRATSAPAPQTLLRALAAPPMCLRRATPATPAATRPAAPLTLRNPPAWPRWPLARLPAPRRRRGRAWMRRAERCRTRGRRPRARLPRRATAPWALQQVLVDTLPLVLHC